jgi:hypothetical protein
VNFKPSILLRFHGGLKRLKYGLLYSARRTSQPGPEGPAPERIQAMHDQQFARYRIRRPAARIFGQYTFHWRIHAISAGPARLPGTSANDGQVNELFPCPLRQGIIIFE